MDCVCLFFPASMVVCTGSLDQIQEENLRKKSHTELAVHAAHSTVVQFCYKRGLKSFSKLIQNSWTACACSSRPAWWWALAAWINFKKKIWGESHTLSLQNMLHIAQCTEVHFAIFLSRGFTTTAVINLLERKLAKRTSVQWSNFDPTGVVLFLQM